MYKQLLSFKRQSLISIFAINRFTSVTAQPAPQATGDKFEKLKEHILNYKPKSIINGKLEKISYKDGVEPALKVYTELGFKSHQLARLWKMKPTSLSLFEDKEQNDIKKLSTFLKDTLNLNESMIRLVVFKSPNILSNSIAELKEQVETLKKELNINEDGLGQILFLYPQIFNKNLIENIKNVKFYLKHYALLSDAEIGTICAQNPYLFWVQKQNFESNFKYLVFRGYEALDLKHLVKENPLFLTMNYEYFQKTVQVLESLFKDKSLVKQIVKVQPQLLSQCPHTMVAPKINYFKTLELEIDQIGQILQINPNYLLKNRSTQSLKLKVEYLKKFFHFDIQKEKFFPEILTYSYWDQIRPRGELLRQRKLEFQWKDVLQLSDQDFQQQFQIQPQVIAITYYQLKEWQKAFENNPKNTQEKDYKKYFFTKNYLVGRFKK